MQAALVRSTLLFALFFSAGIALAQEDYSLWGGSQNIILNTKSSGAGVTGTITRFPVLIRLTSADSTIFLASQSLGQDIRFAKANGAHLAYQIEQWDPAGRKAAIWVLLDTVRGSDSAAYAKIYYSKPGAADSSKSAAVFDTANSYRGVWHLNEAAGQNAADATANGFAGTPGGSTTPQDYQGIIGRAKDFDGASSCFTMNNTATGKLDLPSGGPMTISAWINTDVINGGKYVVSKGEQYAMYFRSTNPYHFAMVEVGTDGRKRYAEKDTVGFIGVWHHAVGIRTATKISLYIDGQWVSDSSSVGSSTRSTTSILNIGRQQPNSNQWFDGRIDEVEIANVARSADWIKLSFENQKATQTLVSLIPGSTPVQPPAAPVLSEPTNGAASVALTPTLSWGTVANAATYRVQVATNSTFSTTVVDEASLTSGTKTVASPLSGSTSYIWRASAYNAGGMSPWSAAWTFTTIVTAPVSPTLGAPSNASVNVPITATLSWGTVSNAATYRLQLSTASSFATTVIDDSTLTTGSKTASGLANNKVYYWRVDGKGTGGTGLWSPTWSFTTITGSAVQSVIGNHNPEACSITRISSGKSSISLRFHVPSPGSFTIALYDPSGRVRARFLRSHLAAGAHTAVVNTSGIAAGSYILRLSGSFGAVSREIVIGR